MSYTLRQIAIWFTVFVGLQGLDISISDSQEVAKVRTLMLEPVDDARKREVPLKIYYVPAKQPQPVIVFSHGLGGSRINNPYLGNHWAQHGFVVVFVQHLGSDESVWKNVPLREIKSALQKAASHQAAMDRVKDIPFVIDQLQKWNRDESNALFNRLDLEHLGMTGHSFGAVTTQAMMGQVFPGGRTETETRFDAFLPMSPSTHRTMKPQDSFGNVTKPVLCMTGTRDESPIRSHTTAETRAKVFRDGLSPGDKYQVVFKDAEHHAFGDRKVRRGKRVAHHHPAILKISTQFWNAYLKGDLKAKKWLQSAQVRTDAKLVKEDVWEWK